MSAFTFSSGDDTSSTGTTPADTSADTPVFRLAPTPVVSTDAEPMLHIAARPAGADSLTGLPYPQAEAAAPVADAPVSPSFAVPTPVADKPAEVSSFEAPQAESVKPEFAAAAPQAQPAQAEKPADTKPAFTPAAEAPKAFQSAPEKPAAGEPLPSLPSSAALAAAPKPMREPKPQSRTGADDDVFAAVSSRMLAERESHRQRMAALDKRSKELALALQEVEDDKRDEQARFAKSIEDYKASVRTLADTVETLAG